MGLMARLRSPRWIAAHLLVAVTIPGFVALGLWQYSRHQDRAAFNDAVRAGLAAPAVPLEDDPEPYRRVVARGRYVPEDELLLTPRALQGQAGHHVLTPLVTGSGEVLLVDRGWVPYDRRPPVPDAPVPDGEVTVEGVLMPPRAQGRFGVDVPDSGPVQITSVVDTDRLAAQMPGPLHSGYLLLAAQDPAPPGSLPIPPEPPDLEAGPHLSYAVQWFLFAGVVAVGYPLLLRRVARDRVK